jgi:hypothetical protein
VVRKEVYGSEARLAGMGCYTLLLCGGVFVFFYSGNKLTKNYFFEGYD